MSSTRSQRRSAENIVGMELSVFLQPEFRLRLLRMLCSKLEIPSFKVAVSPRVYRVILS
jgi:hypothetical protein